LAGRYSPSVRNTSRPGAPCKQRLPTQQIAAVRNPYRWEGGLQALQLLGCQRLARSVTQRAEVIPIELAKRGQPVHGDHLNLNRLAILLVVRFVEPARCFATHGSTGKAVNARTWTGPRGVATSARGRPAESCHPIPAPTTSNTIPGSERRSLGCVARRARRHPKVKRYGECNHAGANIAIVGARVITFSYCQSLVPTSQSQSRLASLELLSSSIRLSTSGVSPWASPRCSSSAICTPLRPIARG